MKNRDLIAKLQKLPLDADIVKSHYSENEYHYLGEELLIKLEEIELLQAHVLCETMECTPIEFTREKPKFSPDKKADVIILKF